MCNCANAFPLNQTHKRDFFKATPIVEVQHTVPYSFEEIVIVLVVSTFLADGINAFLSDHIESKALPLGVVATCAKRQALRLPNLISVNETTDGGIHAPTPF